MQFGEPISFDELIAATYGASDAAGSSGRACLDPRVPTPVAVLGEWFGTRPASGESLLRYANEVANASDRVRVTYYGESSGDRPLAFVAVSSAARTAEGGGLYERLRCAGDGVPDANLPVSVWIGCGIHGDETSGGDAAIVALYRLAAGTDAETLDVLDRLVIHLDPVANPDGRARFIASTAMFTPRHPSLDGDDVADVGAWPSARGNHYLFDLNRDLILQTQPETRARVAAMATVSPQLVLELHEMGPDDSFLFASPGAPLNPLLPPHVHRWWDHQTIEHGATLDRLGQAWYRGEWNEVFYPGYQDIWPAYGGAVPIIFEQARTGPTAVRLPSGAIRNYTDAVLNQAASMFANLRGVATDPAALLRDWAAARAEQRARADGYVIEFGSRQVQRARWLASCLEAQGIEMSVVHDTDNGDRIGGALVVRGGQPLGRLVDVLLADEIPLPADTLTGERARLDRGSPSAMFDVTAWSPVLLAGLRAEHRDNVTVPDGASTWDESSIGGCDRTATVGYLFHDDDYRMALAAASAGVAVRALRSPMDHGDRHWPAGSLLVRLGEQATGVDAHEVLDQLGRRHRIDVIATDTSRSSAGADLGGRASVALRAPRIAVVVGSGIDEPSFGAVRHLLDVEAGVPSVLVEPIGLSRRPLRGIDVVVLPELDGADTHDVLGPSTQRWLTRWIDQGGTLIAMGTSADAPGEIGIGGTRVDRSLARWLPSGAFVEVHVDPGMRTLGVELTMPVLWRGAGILRPGGAAAVPVRHAGAGGLRRGGLVWDEAVEALAGTAFMTVERVGDGAVVLFASDPLWRGAARATSRLLVRSLLTPPIAGDR